MSRAVLVPMVLFLGVGALGVATIVGEEPPHEPSSWYTRNDGTTHRELVFIPEGKGNNSKRIEVGANVCILWQTMNIRTLTVATAAGSLHKPQPVDASRVYAGGMYRPRGVFQLEFGSTDDASAYVELKSGPYLSRLCEEWRSTNGWGPHPVKVHHEVVTLLPKSSFVYHIPASPNQRFQTCLVLQDAEGVRRRNSANIHTFYNDSRSPTQFKLWAFVRVPRYDCNQTAAYLRRHNLLNAAQ